MVEPDIFHDVVALSIGKGIILFTQMPLAGEIGIVATGFKDRSKRPFGCWKAAALTLKGNGRHARTVRDAAGLHGCTSRCAAWLCIEGCEHHAFVSQFIDIGGWHAARFTTQIRAGIAIAGIIGNNKQDVWLFRILCECQAGQGGAGKSCCQ